MAKKFDLSGLRVPEHVAIILDGNGRWAKKHHVPKNVGHSKGSDNVEKIVEAAHDMGIKYITVYAFSSELSILYLIKCKCQRREIYFVNKKSYVFYISYWIRYASQRNM